MTLPTTRGSTDRAMTYDRTSRNHRILTTNYDPPEALKLPYVLDRDSPSVRRLSLLLQQTQLQILVQGKSLGAFCLWGACFPLIGKRECGNTLVSLSHFCALLLLSRQSADADGRRRTAAAGACPLPGFPIRSARATCLPEHSFFATCLPLTHSRVSLRHPVQILCDIEDRLCNCLSPFLFIKDNAYGLLSFQSCKVSGEEESSL